MTVWLTLDSFWHWPVSDVVALYYNCPIYIPHPWGVHRVCVSVVCVTEIVGQYIPVCHKTSVLTLALHLLVPFRNKTSNLLQMSLDNANPVSVWNRKVKFRKRGTYAGESINCNLKLFLEHIYPHHTVWNNPFGQQGTLNATVVDDLKMVTSDLYCSFIFLLTSGLTWH